MPRQKRSLPSRASPSNVIAVGEMQPTRMVGDFSLSSCYCRSADAADGAFRVGKATQQRKHMRSPMLPAIMAIAEGSRLAVRWLTAHCVIAVDRFPG